MNVISKVQYITDDDDDDDDDDDASLLFHNCTQCTVPSVS